MAGAVALRCFLKLGRNSQDPAACYPGAGMTQAPAVSTACLVKALEGTLGFHPTQAAAHEPFGRCRQVAGDTLCRGHTQPQPSGAPQRPHNT